MNHNYVNYKNKKKYVSKITLMKTIHISTK